MGKENVKWHCTFQDPLGLGMSGGKCMRQWLTEGNITYMHRYHVMRDYVWTLSREQWNSLEVLLMLWYLFIRFHQILEVSLWSRVKGSLDFVMLEKQDANY